MDRNCHFYNGPYNTTVDRWSCHLPNRNKTRNRKYRGNGRLRGNVRTSSIKKRIKTRCYQERVGQPRFQGEGVVSVGYFLVSTKLDTFCYLTVQTAPCYTGRRFGSIPACDRRRDGRTDGRTDGRKCYIW